MAEYLIQPWNVIFKEFYVVFTVLPFVGNPVYSILSLINKPEGQKQLEKLEIIGMSNGTN